MPREGEVLVKILAASVIASDLETLRGDFIVRIAAPRKPMHRILGSDIAGWVEAVGENVKLFKPGDEVWGDLSKYSRMTIDRRALITVCSMVGGVGSESPRGI